MCRTSPTGSRCFLRFLSESAGQPQLPIEWFAVGIIDRERKLGGYLLSSTHPDGSGTAAITMRNPTTPMSWKRRCSCRLAGKTQVRDNSFQPKLPQPYCNPLGYAVLTRCPRPRLGCSPGEHSPLRLRFDFLSRALNERRGLWRSRWRPSRPTGREQGAHRDCTREPEVGFLARRDFDDDDTDRALATTIAVKETAYTYTCLATACWAVY